MRISIALASLLTGILLMTASTGPASARDLENTLYMDLKDGRVVIELRPDLAPITVTRIKELVRQHFYDGLKFHRVIAGFMAQTGDPKGDGTGGSGRDLPDEFTHHAHFVRGAVGMANTGQPNTSDSQFFICLDDSEFLDGKYTLFGQVVEGMQFVDHIKTGPKQLNGKVLGEPDRIVKLQVAADVK
jgi:peptidylprolyl isomerase